MIKPKMTYSGKGSLIGLLGMSALLLAGCSGTEDSDSPVVIPPVEIGGVTLPAMNKPADIASVSADDYNQNTYGLITGTTLVNWVTDWPNNKPAGIEGKLVILQAGSGEADAEYIAPDNVNVFTYAVESSEWVETRSNGVVVTKSLVPSGPKMDTFLEKYNIDTNKDMVVCAMGTAGSSQAMSAGRCWYMFRYWGVPKGRLAVLNGGNAWNVANNALPVSKMASTPPYTGTASVRDLPQLNFALQATLEDMMAAVASTDSNILGDGIFIWDARSTNQYDPVSNGVDDGDDDFQSGAVQGHPNGALQLNFASLLNSSEGYTYKSKADLAAYLNGDVVDGASFVDGSLQGVGSGMAYQEGDTIYTYCETTFRAMITGFTTAAILGKPTRFYDGAMTEWHSLTSRYDSNGELLLPTDSPWRTDDVNRSYSFDKSVPVEPPANSEASGYIVDPYSKTAHRLILEDYEYKTGTSIDTSSSESSGKESNASTSNGSAPVANGCG
ncbi:MAG: sulfurtransferase [Gammaproteobacteria bacterium]|nr:sulfurtransferase [Gammaproteobacteria bacterium]